MGMGFGERVMDIFFSIPIWFDSFQWQGPNAKAKSQEGPPHPDEYMALSEEQKGQAVCVSEFFCCL